MLKDFLELLKGVSLSPVQLSLELAAVTTLVLLLIGLPLSWWLARGQSQCGSHAAARTSAIRIGLLHSRCLGS